jgi:hypothetical protein
VDLSIDGYCKYHNSAKFKPVVDVVVVETAIPIDETLQHGVSYHVVMHDVETQTDSTNGSYCCETQTDNIIDMEEEITD